jgi:hypothetical protein
VSPVNYKGVSVLGLGLSSDRMLNSVGDKTRRACVRSWDDVC